MDDYTWLLIAALLVFVMQPGFLCLESGRVRSKNSINVAAKNVADFTLSIIIFWLFGFSLMFGESYWGLISNSISPFDVQDRPWDISFFLFQVMFCGTATTLMSGAVAERMSFIGYLAVALILSSIIYPITGHWAWAGLFNSDNPGWLQSMGFVDFAGSMVVHGVGGWVALVAIMIIGPRIGRFSHGHLLPQGSNLPLSALGTLLIWFGWFGFNGGSTLIMDAQVPTVLLNTCIAAAWAGVTASVLHYYLKRYVDVSVLFNGIIGGLVGITAGCHAVSTPAAMLIGVVSGGIVFYGERYIASRKIDDALGVVPAHLFSGIWGVVAVGLFGDLDVLGTGLTRVEQLKVQLIGVIAISVWSAGVAYLALRALNRYLPLRVTEEHETQGMNVAEHNAATELFDLLIAMQRQQDKGDFSSRVPEHPFTEVGLIATQYNKVIEKVQIEISARDNAIDSFQASELRKSAILDSSMDSIVTLDKDGNILEFNSAAEKTFDSSGKQVKGENFIDYFVTDKMKSSFDDSLSHGFMLPEGFLMNRRNTITLLRKGGSSFPAEISITHSKHNNSTLIEYVLNIRDVTRQKKLQEKLRQLAYSDPLTGLYNRAYLVEKLNRALDGLKNGNDSLVGFFLDLDKFKRINDTMGHQTGDELLCEVANRLTLVTRESDIITRWGGDEFIILMQGNINRTIAESKAQEILDVMRESVELGGASLNIPTSIGITIASREETDANAFIQQADLAMYQAKLEGRDNYRFFEPEMAQKASKNFIYERSLKEDLNSERFNLVYQPKVDHSGRVVGLEALSRWAHKEDGNIPPSVFIPIAEESNLIISIGEQVIQRTLAFLSHLRDTQRRLVPISVNVSEKQLLSPDFLTFLQAQLEHYELSGEWLEIEITEGVLVSDIERSVAVMEALKQLGVSISIDDFGTGYSSLSYLKQLPLDTLKIDKSFVDECHAINEDGKICSTIIHLAKNLELNTIAEGVETLEQLDFLIAHGCQYFQGYYFYKPLPPEDVVELLTQSRQASIEREATTSS